MEREEARLDVWMSLPCTRARSAWGGREAGDEVGGGGGVVKKEKFLRGVNECTPLPVHL